MSAEEGYSGPFMLWPNQCDAEPYTEPLRYEAVTGFGPECDVGAYRLGTFIDPRRDCFPQLSVSSADIEGYWPGGIEVRDDGRPSGGNAKSAPAADR